MMLFNGPRFSSPANICLILDEVLECVFNIGDRGEPVDTFLELRVLT